MDRDKIVGGVDFFPGGGGITNYELGIGVAEGEGAEGDGHAPTILALITEAFTHSRAALGKCLLLWHDLDAAVLRWPGSCPRDTPGR